MECQFSFNTRMLVLLVLALILALGLSFGLGWMLGADRAPAPVVKADIAKDKT
jgi:hypothetical protein